MRHGIDRRPRKIIARQSMVWRNMAGERTIPLKYHITI
jgi:hypothetical protein